MAKGFKFPAPKGYAKGGMCKPKGMKGYAKGGPARGTNMEASDMYDPSDLRTLEAGQNVPRENKNRMRSESTQYAKAADRLDRAMKYEQAPGNETSSQMKDRMARNKARLDDFIPANVEKSRAMDETGGYASGGKVTMAKTKMGRKFAKVKTAYADGGEVETEQSMSKATKVKMPKGAAPKGRARAVPVAGRAPVIAPPQAAPMAGGMGQSPLARVARAAAPMPGAARPMAPVGPRMGMGMKMGGKAKKR